MGCRADNAEVASAPEPPPPLIEPELGPGAGLVDPRAEALVRQMSERLARAKAFALEAEELYDEVPEHSPRRQLTSTRRAALRRPDRLVGDVSGDAMNRSFWYDGKMFAALDKEQHVWASGGVPPTVDAALDWVFEQTGTVVPLADFLYVDSYERLMGAVQRGEYLGVHEAAGVPCHHLAFEQATIDWQLWIEAGQEPLPRKLVITYKTEDEVPQVHGDHPEVESRATATGCAVRLHTARWRRACRGTGIRRPGGTAGGRSAMSRHLAISVALIALVIGSNPALGAATQPWIGVVGAGDLQPLRQHGLRAGAACERHADGEPDRFRRDGHPAGRDAERCDAEHDQGSGRREPRGRQDDNRHDGVGRVRYQVPTGRGAGRLRDRRGERAHQHRAFGLRRRRGGPHLHRPAGGGRNGQHQIQRHLQRRRRPHAVRGVEHCGGRPVRRTCDDHAAFRLPHHDLLRTTLLQLWRGLLPPVYVRWRSLLLPGAATVLLVLQLPAAWRDDSDDCGDQVPGVARRQLLQADDDQRRKDGIPGGARAAGRRRWRRCRRRACS